MRFDRTRPLLLTIASLFSLLWPFSRAEAASKTIGILSWNQQEPRYAKASRIFIDQLRRDGFDESKVRVLVASAEGNKALALEHTRIFIAEKVDLLMPIGTPAAMIVANEVADKPIVFTLVYDPIGAGISRDWASSGNNTTGSSTYIPAATLLKRIKTLVPIKILAVLYTPGEKNSEIQFLDLQKAQRQSGVQVLPVPVGSLPEISTALSLLVTRADSLYVTGSSVISKHLDEVIAASTKAGLVTITHLEDVVERGALLGVIVDIEEIARAAARRAAKILGGAAPRTLPIWRADKHILIVNAATLNNGAFKIPRHLLKSGVRIIR